MVIKILAKDAKFAFLQQYFRYINLPERLSRTLVGPIFGERFKIAI